MHISLLRQCRTFATLKDSSPQTHFLNSSDEAQIHPKYRQDNKINENDSIYKIESGAKINGDCKIIWIG
jgi:hypothetical protein